MEKWKKQALNLVTALALEERADPSVCTYKPSKLSVSETESDELPAATPEACGIGSKRLSDMIGALEAEPRANVHALYIVKDGRRILSCARAGYDVHTRYLSHSMAKTVTGMVIGTLVEEGALSLSDPVASFFPEYTYRDRRFGAMTVEHLLTMSSGAPFNEAGVVTEDVWGQAFFASPLSFAPGSSFMYNSMNSYMLGRIAEKVSGKELFTLADERLFRPLGITNAFWEKNAEGYAKGGFGLYLSACSWAKLGMLFLQNGTYRGRRILSEAWIRSMSYPHRDTPTSLGDFNYGYHMWVGRNGEDILFNGMLGQNVWICPRTRTVAVLLCGNSELFQQSPALSIVRHALSSVPVGERSPYAERRRLRTMTKHFFEQRREVLPKSPAPRTLLGYLTRAPRNTFDPAWEPLLGTYRMSANNAALLPLFARLMQNNYESDGIRELLFAKEGNSVCMTVSVGASTYRIPIGLYEHAACTLRIGGEPYLVKTLGEAIIDGEGNASYKLEMIFPELPNTRLINVHLVGKWRMQLSLRETPNERLTESFKSSFLSERKASSAAFSLFEKMVGEHFLEEKVGALFSRTLIGVREGAPSEEDAWLSSVEKERTMRLQKYAKLLAFLRPR